jgi:hypothetical protein
MQCEIMFRTSMVLGTWAVQVDTVHVTKCIHHGLGQRNYDPGSMVCALLSFNRVITSLIYHQSYDLGVTMAMSFNTFTFLVKVRTSTVLESLVGTGPIVPARKGL